MKYNETLSFLYKVSVSDQYRRYKTEFYLVSDQTGNQWHRTSLVTPFRQM